MKLTLSFILSISSIIAFSQSTFFITTADGLSSNGVTCFVEDFQNNIWVGTDNGLSKIDPLGNVSAITATLGYVINDLDFDASGGVWAATEKGVLNYASNILTVYDTALGLSVNNVNQISVLNNGDVWCINLGRLFKFSSGSFQLYSSVNPDLLNQNVRFIQKLGSDLYVKTNYTNDGFKITGNGDVRISSAGASIAFAEKFVRYNQTDYGYNGTYVFEVKNNTLVILDTVSESFAFSDYTADEQNGKILFRGNNKVHFYDLSTNATSSAHVSLGFEAKSFSTMAYDESKHRFMACYKWGLRFEYYHHIFSPQVINHAKMTYAFKASPKGTHVNTIDTLGKNIALSFYEGFMASAKVNGQQKLAGFVFYGASKEDWVYGPYSNDQILPSYHEKYGREFLITKSEIDFHIQNYNASGYIPSAIITKWPANGNTAAGEPLTLAPFVDLNGNGTYEPKLGDYPEVPGDVCLYAMYHEPAATITEFGLNLEVHHFAYVNHDGSFENEQTIYHNFSVINRGITNLTDFKFALLADLDLGNYANDVCAMDTTSDAFYLWNSDEDIGSVGSSPLQIAEGFISLDHKIASHHVNWPNNVQASINIFNGLKPYGDPIFDSTLNQSGHYEYLWLGDSTFYFTEQSAANVYPQMAVIAPKTLLPNSKQCYNFAFAYDMVNDPLGGLAALKKTKVRLDSVKQLWATSSLMSCLMPTLKLNENETDPELNVFPNPSNGIVNVTSFLKIISIHVYDAKGALLEEVQGGGDAVNFQMNYESGFYILEVKTEKQTFLRKLILSK